VHAAIYLKFQFLPHRKHTAYHYMLPGGAIEGVNSDLLCGSRETHKYTVSQEHRVFECSSRWNIQITLCFESLRCTFLRIWLPWHCCQRLSALVPYTYKYLPMFWRGTSRRVILSRRFTNAAPDIMFNFAHRVYFCVSQDFHWNSVSGRSIAHAIIRQLCFSSFRVRSQVRLRAIHGVQSVPRVFSPRELHVHPVAHNQH
jgi:hypothetical protein